MKIFKFSILFLFLCFSSAFGQTISNVDFDDIKFRVSDSTLPTYYPKLIKRFVAFDSTLTRLDYKLIYYGNVFQTNYSPYGTGDKEDEFLKIYREENYKEAIPLGLEVIKENAVNPKVLFKLLVCYNQLGDKETAKKYARLYWGLLNEIYASGDGSSHETAMVVIAVDDEYEILADSGLNSLGQALSKQTDILTIDTKGQKPAKGQKKIKKLYFNVSKPLGHLSKLFNPDK